MHARICGRGGRGGREGGRARGRKEVGREGELGGKEGRREGEREGGRSGDLERKATAEWGAAGLDVRGGPGAARCEQRCEMRDVRCRDRWKDIYLSI